MNTRLCKYQESKDGKKSWKPGIILGFCFNMDTNTTVAVIELPDGELITKNVYDVRTVSTVKYNTMLNQWKKGEQNGKT